MTSSSSLLRSLLVYGICLPLAVFLGYMITTPLDGRHLCRRHDGLVRADDPTGPPLASCVAHRLLEHDRRDLFPAGQPPIVDGHGRPQFADVHPSAHAEPGPEISLGAFDYFILDFSGGGRGGHGADDRRLWPPGLWQRSPWRQALLRAGGRDRRLLRPDWPAHSSGTGRPLRFAFLSRLYDAGHRQPGRVDQPGVQFPVPPFSGGRPLRAEE